MDIANGDIAKFAELRKGTVGNLITVIQYKCRK